MENIYEEESKITFTVVSIGLINSKKSNEKLTFCKISFF